MKNLIDKLDFIEIKSFCSVKNTPHSLRGLWENICQKHMCKKGYYPKHMNNSERTLTLNGKETKNLILKWAKALNGHFTKKDIQSSNKHN